jgi:hypothetical protein
MAMPPGKKIVERTYLPPAARKGVSEDDRTSVRRPYRVEFKNVPNSTEERLTV